MDFLRIIRSLEDLLYELISWLVFYPRTLARILLHPRQMLQYSAAELTDTPDEQYGDTLSPPLFLMLTVLIAHGLELAVGEPIIRPKGAVGQMLFGSEQNLLLMRSLQFSIYALVGATALLHRRHIALNRRNLRAPFYAQCYLAAPFGLGLSCSAVLTRLPQLTWKLTGVALAVISIVWYVCVLTDWFRRQLSRSMSRAAGIALWCFVQAALCNAVINTLFRNIRP